MDQSVDLMIPHCVAHNTINICLIQERFVETKWKLPPSALALTLLEQFLVCVGLYEYPKLEDIWTLSHRILRPSVLSKAVSSLMDPLFPLATPFAMPSCENPSLNAM